MIFSVICLQDNWNYCKFAKAAMKNQTGSNNIIQTLKYKSIMTKKGEIYICKHCGGMVEILKEGAVPVCCGEPMKLLKENTTDGAKEKHVPVVEKIEGGYRVTVGSVLHPMTPEHYIQFIELITPDGILRRELTPEDKPVAEFKTDATEVTAREYCNLHGLWKA